MNDVAEAKTAPALGISFKASVGDGKELVFQTHVPQEIEPKELNALLDKIKAAAERQGAFADLVQLENELERHMTALSSQDAEAARIDDIAASNHASSGKRGAVALSTTEKKAKENFKATRGKFVEMIGRINEQIDKAKAKIGE